MLQFFTEHKEEWEQLINLTVLLVTWVLAAAALYWKLDKRLAKMEEVFRLFSANAQEHWKKLEDELDRVESKLDAHISAPAPHINCPAHEILIKDLISRVESVHDDVRQSNKLMIQLLAGNKLKQEDD